MMIGRVISQESRRTPNHLEFCFQTVKGYEPMVGDYVRVRTSSLNPRFIVGQVTLAHSGNMYLNNPKIASMYLDSSSEAPPGYGLYELDNWECGVARIIGKVTDKGLEQSGYSPKPGDEVDLLKPDQIGQLLGIPDSGLFIGTGKSSQGEFKVYLKPHETLAHNILICGRIGSGKTYAGGVIIEEFLENNIPVIAVDPHGELGTLAELNDDPEQCEQLEILKEKPKKYETKFYAPPKFALKSKGKVTPFAVSIGLLEIGELTNIIDEKNELGGRQKSILISARSMALKANGMNPNYNVKDLIDKINLIAQKSGKKEDEKSANGIKWRLKKLADLDIFNPRYSIELANLVSNSTATILTLPMVDDSIKRSVVAVIARQLLKARMGKEVSEFLLYVDEGHIFAPSQTNVPSKGPLIRFSKECRKFGAGLCLVSQQPADITDKIRSQCHTRIFLQLDSQSDMSYVRSSITDHWKELVEMVPFFPPGKGILRSKTIRFPLLIQIRPRRSKHTESTSGEGKAEELGNYTSVDFEEYDEDLADKILNITSETEKKATNNKIDSYKT